MTWIVEKKIQISMDKLGWNMLEKIKQIRKYSETKIIINNILYKIMDINWTTNIKGYEYICKKRDGVPCVLTLVQLGVSLIEPVQKVFMRHKMWKHGRVILFGVDLEINLTDQEISHIKKYWNLRDKSIGSTTHDTQGYIDYLDCEYNNYIEKIGLMLNNPDYPDNLFNLINNGICFGSESVGTCLPNTITHEKPESKPEPESNLEPTITNILSDDIVQAKNIVRENFIERGMCLDELTDEFVNSEFGLLLTHLRKKIKHSHHITSRFTDGNIEKIKQVLKINS